MLAIFSCVQSFPIPELDSAAEMVWARISIQGSRELYVSSFYHSHAGILLRNIAASVWSGLWFVFYYSIDQSLVWSVPSVGLVQTLCSMV